METKNTIKSDNTEVTMLKTKPVAAAATGAAGAAAVAGAAKKAARPSLWKSVLVGGVPGILIGASGNEYVSAHAASAIEDPENPEDIETGAASSSASGVSSEILEAHSVSDDMSFGEAFASARAEVGAGGAFVWHGNVYGTYRADDPEWIEMSSEDRMAHSEQILSQVHAAPYTPVADEPEIVEIPDHGQYGEEALLQDDELETEVDVHIVGVDTIETDGAGDIPVAYGEVDGLDAVFADTDGDGEVDLVMLDVNGDGQASLDEVMDASGSGIMMEDLAAEASLNNTEMVDDQLYSDMPDYSNDADMGSLV